ncbi:MAG: hypothetical protein WCA21_05160 [Terracidiphilus sp.]
MENTCNRCHQTLLAESCYCASCGLPQLVYAADGATGQNSPERWNEAVRDAAQVDWKPALRVTLAIAIPAGALCFILSPLLGIYGLLWMAVAAAWVVMLYMRSQRPAWITLGAGARIGLVTGLAGGWTAAAASAFTLFAMRFIFHHGNEFDDFWQNQVSEKVSQQWAASGYDAQQVLTAKAMLNSPEGRSGLTITVIFLMAVAMVVFATAGGALGARMLSRRRQPEI